MENSWEICFFFARKETTKKMHLEVGTCLKRKGIVVSDGFK